ncbi:MAG: hypothetical protein LAP40_26640 [Acidobacteriia bacterium]|nr:hypothetical protein [Terriglobia bacterium]
MRLRTLALVLALACGFTTTVEARHRPASSARKAKKFKTPKGKKYKARKVQRHR